MKPINIRLIDDDLVVYAVNVMMFSFEDVCKFTESDWLKVLDRYEMQINSSWKEVVQIYYVLK